MPDGGTLLNYLHVLAAMLYVTGYVTGAVLQLAAGRATDWPTRRTLMRYANLFTIRLLVPGFVAAGVLGIATALVLGYPLLTGWVRNALVLYIVILATGVAYWTPLGKKQEAAALAGDEAAFSALAQRRATRYVATLDALVVLLLTYLMVVKPA